MNTLYYGDNLDILREHIHDNSVDLIYLDPPFNSARTFNVLFADEKGNPSEAQIHAFDDTWHWNQSAAATYNHLVTNTTDEISQMIAAIRVIVKDGPMLAYLVMMAARLIELYRVLKPTGSLYLHCDQTASSYLRVILDTIFGPRNFRNEVVWKRTSSHNDAKRRYGDLCDCIFFYTKSDTYPFHVQYGSYSESYLKAFYRYVDEKGRRFRLSDLRSPNPRPNLMYEYKGYKPHPNGWAVSQERMKQLDDEGRLHFPKKTEGRIQLRRYLEEMSGMPVGNVWDDIQPVQAQAAERLGYPTQKPLALLERIILTSSKAGDVVLDPFCGCGTAIAAAQKLDRQWIGIDITSLAIALIKSRMEGMFPGVQIKTVGDPKDLAGARHLAQEDRYQFQWWALSLIPARPLGGSDGSKAGKKGSDRGIDGVINFIDDASGMPKRVLVQVKSGHVKSGDIRDLVGTVQREKAAIGVFVTLETPSKDMTTEAVSAGFYHSDGWGKDYPRVQILTIADLLRGAQVMMPPAHGTFKQSKAVKAVGRNTALEFDTSNEN